MNENLNQKWTHLTDYVQELVEKYNVPGVSIGICKDGHHFSDGFGITSADNPLPVTPQTLFQIGSITKTFTAMAIMRLVEMDIIDLDATVRTYIPEFQVADKETSSTVTIRHLLTHTAGWMGDFFIGTGSGTDAMARYAERMVDLDQISPVGELMSYNNSGFYLLGHIIEVVTDNPYEEAIRELVIKPLELERFFFESSDVMVNRFAVGHFEIEDEVKVAKPWALPRAAYPAGGLACDVDGLLMFGEFNLGDGQNVNDERILEIKTMEMMQTPQVQVWGEDECIGLSWFIDTLDGTKIISHGGGTMGQVSLLLFVPDHMFALVILTNAGSGGQLISETKKWCLREYIGLDINDPETIDVPLEKMRECEGRYFFARMGYTDIGILGERLIAQPVSLGGFPTEDTPSQPAPPPSALKFIEEDRLIVTEGGAKYMKVDLIRDTMGVIRWIRYGGRLRKRKSILT